MDAPRIRYATSADGTKIAYAVRSERYCFMVHPSY